MWDVKLVSEVCERVLSVKLEGVVFAQLKIVLAHITHNRSEVHRGFKLTALGFGTYYLNIQFKLVNYPGFLAFMMKP